MQLDRLDQARIAVAADAIAAALAPLLPDASPQADYGPAQAYQQLIALPQGTGTAGASYVVQSDPMWPLSVMCRLTTSNAVADRTVAVEYQDGDGVRFVVAGTQAVVQASGQQSFCWFGSAGSVAWPIEDAALAPLPQMYLTYNQRLALHVWNGDSGDVLDQIRISARFDPRL
jgi:hypothetical protein